MNKMTEETFSEDKRTLIKIQAEEERYIVPDHIKHIKQCSFRGSIKQIVLSEGVESIDNSAFCELNNLSSVVISSTVAKIDDLAFWGCFSLESITVSEDNPYYTAIDGILYNKDLNKIIAYPVKRRNTDFILPESVTEIPGGLFRGAVNLKTVTLHDKVTKIGFHAFSTCTSLTVIDIPKSVNVIEDRAFYNCQRLSCPIVIPNGVKILETAIFKYSPISSIELPESIEVIKGAGDDSILFVKEIKFHKKDPNEIKIDRLSLCWGKLYVPKESIDLYKNNVHFSKAEIIPL